MLLSILAGQLSSRIGAPLLLTFLSVGIFFGEDGPGGIVFNDKETAYMACSIALAIILFDGGLRTRLETFRQAVRPALLLATLGVMVTAGIVAIFAIWFLGISPLHSLLIGSIVASTDAAAVFLLLHQRDIRLKRHISATLEVESGINDPMAILLTITCVELMLGDPQSGVVHMLSAFAKQMGLGLMAGYAGGMALSHGMRRLKLDAGLYPVMAMTAGLLIFGGTNFVGGSGFLAVYLAGLTFANSGFPKTLLIKQFNDGMAWVAQIIMLLVLGLLVTPSHLVDYLAPALWIALALIVLARPMAVWLCLSFDGFTWREKTFVSWVGLRGAIPLYLALIPALSGIDNGRYYFNIAFIIVLTSLITQGWSINPLARWLRLDNKEDARSSGNG